MTSLKKETQDNVDKSLSSRVYNKIRKNKLLTASVLCAGLGGAGLAVNAVIDSYSLPPVPEYIAQVGEILPGFNVSAKNFDWNLENFIDVHSKEIPSDSEKFREYQKQAKTVAEEMHESIDFPEYADLLTQYVIAYDDFYRRSQHVKSIGALFMLMGIGGLLVDGVRKIK